MAAKFYKISETMSPRYLGKTVKIRGWVYRERSGKDVAFLVLRDSSGIIQCTVKKRSPYFKKAKKLLIESAVEIEGKVRKDPRAPGGYEIGVKKIKVVSKAERFPITKDQSKELLLDMRHLWVRSQKMINVMKVRSTIFNAIHEYFRKQGFYEVQSPCFTPTAGEGGATMFKVDYFGKKANLTQTWQLYAEAMVLALENIYTIAPSFRAEKSRTTRHLTEYWHAEMEIAWGGLDEIIKHGEGVVSHICQKVARKNAKELRALGRNPKDLKKIKPPFPHLTYDKVLEILKKDGMKVKWGKDLRTLEERQIASHYKKPVVVTHYPKKVMAFYKPPDPKNPKVALCFDMISPEIGVEIIGGSERDSSVKRMTKWLKKQGDNPKNYEWYFDLRRYGDVRHAGWGMGVDRVVQWICKLEDIKDAIPFPRTIDRFSP